MLKSQFIFLCERLGNSNLKSNEKWKSIKYIFIENPIIDVQRLLRTRQIMYIDNSSIGPGFYIMGNSNSNLGVPKYNEQVITFIPLSIIDKISIISTSDKDDNDNEDNKPIFVSTEDSTLILNNLEVDSYEDIIIINNAIAKTDGDALIIEKI